MSRANSLRRRVWVATRLTRLFMRVGVRILRLYTVEVEGQDNIPQRGAATIAARHLSTFDPILMLGTLRHRRNIAFIAMQELFKGRFGRIMNWHGHIPVDRSDPKSGRTAISRGQAVHAGGGLVGIFLEGKCSRDGQLLRAKPGVGYLGDGIPTIPCWINGTDRALPLGGKPKLHQHLVVRYGPALYKNAVETPQAFADRVMTAIAVLGDVPAPTIT